MYPRPSSIPTACFCASTPLPTTSLLLTCYLLCIPALPFGHQGTGSIRSADSVKEARLLDTYYCLLLTDYLLLTTCYSIFTSHYLLLTIQGRCITDSYSSVKKARLLNTYYFLPYYLLLTIWHLLLKAQGALQSPLRKRGSGVASRPRLK